MIDESIVKEAKLIFQQVTEGKWPDVSTEIQDNSLFLLIMVSLPNGESCKIDTPLRVAIANSLNGCVPVRENGEDSWMVTFLENSSVCESILPMDSNKSLKERDALKRAP